MPPRAPRNTSARPAPSPVVYVIRSDRSGLLKIGTTANLQRRLGELSRLCKGAVTLLATLPGDASTEKTLHALCAMDLVAGEWFRPSREVLDILARAKASAARATAAATAHAANDASAAAWNAIEPRAGLSLCPCTRPAEGRTYARSTCAGCHGAGVRAAPLDAESLAFATREALDAITPPSPALAPVVRAVADRIAAKATTGSR